VTLEEFEAEIARLTRERDMAVRDLHLIAQELQSFGCTDLLCETCRHCSAPIWWNQRLPQDKLLGMART